jgi:hypothetical protein
MTHPLPHLSIPAVPDDWHRDLPAWDWSAAAILPPFTLADGSGPAVQQTVARVCYNRHALFVRFDCQDTDIWGTHTERDQPIYDEEVVEVFLAAGVDTPVDYAEFEVSPNGVLLDVLIHNPGVEHDEVQTDFAWNCPGLAWHAERDDAADGWWAMLAIPWAAVGAPAGALPRQWRANFYRIERPRGAAPEFSCWSPTLTEPANFHRPERFGYLELG